MEIQYLKEFLVLAEYLNFSKASEELYVSQPVLSKHIISLEKELGIPLFHRNSRNVSLTEWGKEYLVLAEEIVSAYDKSNKHRKHYLRRKASTLSIGLVENPQVFGLDMNLIDFHREYPYISIRTHEDTEKNLWKLLDQGTLNLITTAISPEELSPDDFIPVYFGNLEICISVNDILSHKDKIALSEIKDRNIYFPPKDGSFSILLESAFEDHKMSMQNVNYGNYYAEMRFAEADLGIAIMPSHIMDSYPVDTIRHIPLDPAIPYIAGLKFTKKRALTDTEKIFIDYARKFADSLK